MHDLLDHLLTDTPDLAPIDGVDAWWARVQALPFANSGARAAAGGFASDRLGWAFASGYHAALSRLVPGLTAKAALCATEDRGAHPRHIHTTLRAEGDGFSLHGTKGFVTLGTAAEVLLVVASEGLDPEGRNRLRLVRVPSDAPGLTVDPQPTLPFVPEIPHARLVLDGVAVPAQAVLPGDGYADFLKPFRTVEDLHVHAALYGWIVRLARRWGWPDVHLEHALTLLTTAVALCAADPKSVGVHRALAGLLDETVDLLGSVEMNWPMVDAEVRVRWERDRPLLQIAKKSRTARRAAARLRGSGVPS